MLNLTRVLVCCGALAAPGAVSAASSLIDQGSPAAIAISQDPPGHWVFRSFPAFLPLYVFDGDVPGSGKSMCDDACAAVWPIIKAGDDDKPTGDWTIVERNHGVRQWAYKGKPLYTFYLDTTNNPKGVGRTATWYLDEYAPDGTQRKVAVKSNAKPAWRLLDPNQ